MSTIYLTKEVYAIPILLSIGIAFLGSYATVTVYEQFRLSSKINRSKVFNSSFLLVLTSVCLGGVTIWAMHFIGMNAVILVNPETNEVVPIQFQILQTIISLVVVLILAYAGLYISSRNKVFTKDKTDAVEQFIKDSRDMSIKEIRSMKSKYDLLISLLTEDLKSLVIGGVIAATGVCVMHYVGMAGVVFEGYIEWNAGIVFASVLIALVAATAGFWILFRLLSLFPYIEVLRGVCAVIITVAVNGMHYTGMAAASYVYEAGKNTNISSAELIDQSTAMYGALLASIVVVSFVFILAVADLRSWYVVM